MRENISVCVQMHFELLHKRAATQRDVNADLCGFTRKSCCNSNLCPSGSEYFYFLPFFSSQHRCDMTLTLQVALQSPQPGKRGLFYEADDGKSGQVIIEMVYESVFIKGHLQFDGKCILLQLHLRENSKMKNKNISLCHNRWYLGDVHFK